MYKRFCDWCKKEFIDSRATLDLWWNNKDGKSLEFVLCKDCAKKVEDLAIRSQAERG